MKISFRGLTQKDGLLNLFGHTRTRAYLSEKSYVDIGRFSLGIVNQLRFFTNGNFSGLVARVGDYCEFSGCHILVGGEHRNFETVNLNFSSSPVFQKLLVSSGYDVRHSRKGPLVIGNGVVVGYGATILSGVNIGDGAVIAAGAVVSKSCESFGIYAGNPARLIKFRDVDRDYFSKFIQQSVQGAYYLLTKETTAEEEPETEKNKRVVIQVQYLDAVRGGPYKVQVKGALINDHLVPLRAGSEFQGYCAQLGLGPDRELTWVSDPLSLSM